MIPPDVIATVKDRSDLAEIVGESVRLTRRGRSYVGLCPFHQEKTPSFHVNPERGFAHCFGCKWSGGAVDFVMQTEGLSFPDAIRALAERVGIDIPDARTEAEQREARAAKRAKDDLYAVNNAAAYYFERMLLGSPGATAHPLAKYAVAEIERRRIDLPAEGNPAAAFRLGYAPLGWDGLATYLRKQGLSLTAAERVGLLVPKQSGPGHYDRFRHRLMFPVIDVQGRVVAFSGRVLPDPTPAEHEAAGVTPRKPDADPPAKYINSPESPIYTKGEHLFGLFQGRQAIRQAGEAVIVEGNFDVVALHARGVSTTVAPLGTAFTGAQAKLLKRFAPSAVLLFDGDAAGQKATRAAREPCKEAGIAARVATLPRGADPDDFVRAKGAAALLARLKAAKGMLEHLIDEALNGSAFEGATLADRADRVASVMRILREERDPMLRALAKSYADRIAAALLVDGRSITDLRQLEAQVRQALAPDAGEAPRGDGHVQTSPSPAMAVVGAILDHPALLARDDVQAAVATLDGDDALAVAAASQSAAVDAFPPSYQRFVAERLAAPVLDREADAIAIILDNTVRKRPRDPLPNEGRSGEDPMSDLMALHQARREMAKGNHPR